MSKKIYKVEDDRKLCGVCGGIAEYLDIDPVIVRVLWLFAVLACGTGILAYIVCAIIFPDKSEVEDYNKNE